ncbi:MAG: histidinol dehydrogenase [Candidatus Hydrogenedentes bacterium]|nr:histidinol dehydrogenase [Candidatus Hydrogenedentota bacterium]
MQVIEIKDDASFGAVAARIMGREESGGDAGTDPAKLDATRDIVQAVRDRGDTAVAEFTERFDKVSLKPQQFEVTSAEIDAAFERIEPATLKALERAHENVSAFHGKNLRQSWEETYPDGSVVGQRLTPVESVGLYVPGGTAFYPSSVLMNIVPARVAGVRDIVMVSPPSFEGGIHPLVLAAARMAGASRVFRVGGAQSIAALAYGTDYVPSVLKIAGPGNIYVTLAKRLVSSFCDIDKEAGPSEVVVIADKQADPDCAALELLAQAEHDPDARVMFVTDSADCLARVQQSVAKHVQTLSRADIIHKALDNFGVAYIVRSIEEGARLTNLIAPEHLSIQTRDPRAVFNLIPNAGCAILGGETSVAVGDYYAGPNHILPTGRRARFASPLTAEDFRKVTSVISFTKERMKAVGPDIIRLAKAEKLDAHARAVEIRQ